MINNSSKWHCYTLFTSIFTRKYLISLTVVSTLLFWLRVENHLRKPKRHIIPRFRIVQQIVSVRASKIHLNHWNIISITLQKWSLKRDKISFVFTKLPWEHILDRYCSIEIPILYSLLSFWSWASNKPFQICFGEFSTVQGECKYNTVYFTLWHFQVPSGTFKHFQTLSGATLIDRLSRYLLAC